MPVFILCFDLWTAVCLIYFTFCCVFFPFFFFILGGGVHFAYISCQIMPSEESTMGVGNCLLLSFYSIVLIETTSILFISTLDRLTVNYIFRLGWFLSCSISIYCFLSIWPLKTKEHKLIRPQNLQVGYINGVHKSYKILLASSGLKQALTSNSGYNRRVAECREAARVLLKWGLILMISLPFNAPVIFDLVNHSSIYSD